MIDTQSQICKEVVCQIYFVSLVLSHWFLMSVVPAFAESSFDRAAKRTGYAYVKKMVTVCNGFSYLKSTDEIRRYKGDDDSLFLRF